MVFLRSFIILILVLCIGWSVLFFGGPLIVKQVVGLLFQNKVELKGVTVTPKLQIKVRQIEFDFSDTNQISNLTGLSRGAQINWSILKFSPTVEFISGFTSLERFGKTGKASLRFEFPNIFQFGSAKTYVQFTDLKFYGELTADKLSLIGNIDFVAAYLRDFYLQAEGFKASNFSPSSADLVTGTVDALKLQEDLLNQKFNVSLASKNIQIDEGRWVLKGADLNINAVGEELVLMVRIPSMTDIKNGYLAEDISLEGKFDSSVGRISNPIEVEIKKISSDEKDVLVENLTSQFYHKNGEFDLEMSFNSAVMETTIYDKFYGKINDAEIKAGLQASEENGEANVNFWLEIEKRKLLELVASLDSSFKLSKVSDLISCLSLACIPERLNASFNVSIRGESLSGKVACLDVRCLPNDSSIMLATTNTAKFFANLTETKILNPVLLAGLFSFVIAGEKNDAGHRVEY